MGLDMYLRAQKYVSGYEHRKLKERNEYERLVELFGVEEFVDEESPSGYVEFTVAYWRKANQIHEWFVQNVQGGVDECQETHVSRDQLQDLLNVCRQVLIASELVDGEVYAGTVYDAKHPEGRVEMRPGQIIADPRIAHELLPRQEGFFFGGMDYDEGYTRALTATIRQVERALRMPEEWDFLYQSSW
jgi:hypothetical protein